MKEIFGYFTIFFKRTNKPVLVTCTLLTGFMIWANYHYGIDAYISRQNSPISYFYYRYLIFLVAFALPYLFYYALNGKNYFQSTLVSSLIIIAPAIFSMKMAINTEINLSEHLLWNDYWNQIIYWPVRLVIMTAILFVIWKWLYRNESFFGLTTRNFKWKPYLLLLLMMIPLIAAASTQSDFLAMYPKMQNISGVSSVTSGDWFYKLLFELSYGNDFISIELFFRGFLILAFLKAVGKDAILPMACFYCTIHFGKPLGECVSSYFGGMLLGIVVYHTRSIYGGLVVHLGIAWLMELGGSLGNL